MIERDQILPWYSVKLVNTALVYKRAADVAARWDWAMNATRVVLGIAPAFPAIAALNNDNDLLQLFMGILVVVFATMTTIVSGFTWYQKYAQRAQQCANVDKECGRLVRLIATHTNEHPDPQFLDTLEDDINAMLQDAPPIIGFSHVHWYAADAPAVQTAEEPDVQAAEEPVVDDTDTQMSGFMRYQLSRLAHSQRGV